MTALHEFVFILAPFLLFLPALLAGFAPRRGGAGEDRQEEKWEGDHRPMLGLGAR
jgi:hypothetical protein